METFAIEGMTKEQNSKLSYIHRHLTHRIAKAKAIMADHVNKLTTEENVSEVLYWSENVFEAGVVLEIYQRYLNSVAFGVDSIKTAGTEQVRQEQTALLAAFVDEFEQRVTREIVNSVRSNVPTQLQTANVIKHYRVKVLTGLLDYVG